MLEGGPIPDDVVPPGHRSFGQNLKPYSALARLARELGLAPLDDFIVDHCGLIEAALCEAGWQEPAGPEEWGDRIPIDDSPITDPKYLAAADEYGRIVERVEAKWSWFSPADGLRTVRGLIDALESRPELNERFYGAVWDLRDFEYKLAYAERKGLRFHFDVSY
jgi:hypothetical protein